MLIIIQNDPEVPPGNLASNLDQLGLPYSLLHPYSGEPLPDLRDISAMIVLGGAMHVNDHQHYPFLIELKKLVRTLAQNGIPYLGICLGGQLLASALGAQVVANRWEELGTLPVELNAEGLSDPLYAGIGSPFTSFQWHHDSFDLPDGALLLASSDACPHQSFRYGKNAWGTQFHPEATCEIIRAWCAWDKDTAARSDQLCTEFNSHSLTYQTSARQMLENFLRIAGLLP
jgi:GMP synthase-like glutamine amidotransferase